MDRDELQRLIRETAGSDPSNVLVSWSSVKKYIEENVTTAADASTAAAVLLRVESFTGTDGEDAVSPVAIVRALLIDRDNTKATAKAREDILETLAWVLDSDHMAPQAAQPYAPPLMAACVNIFSIDEGAARAAALHVVDRLLEMRPLPLTAPDAHAVDVAATLVHKLGTDKNLKTAKTARGAVFTTLGLMLAAFPDELEYGDRFSKQWLLSTTGSLLSKADDKTPMALIGGALDGLAAALALCGPHDAIRERQLAYDHVCNALDRLAGGNVTRYAGVLGAIKLLTMTGAGLAPKIYQDVHRLVPLLIKIASQHSNKKVRNGIEAALSSVLEQASSQFMCGGAARAKESKKRLDTLLGLLHRRIASGDVKRKELGYVLMSLSLLAGPVQRYQGAQGLRQLLVSLQPLMRQEDTDDQQPELEGNRIELEVQLLGVLSSILQRLDSMSEAVVSLCIAAVERILGEYPMLWPAQLPAVHGCLLRLLLAAHTHGSAALAAVMQRVAAPLLAHTLRTLMPEEADSGPIVAALTAANVETPVVTAWQVYSRLWDALLLGTDLPPDATQAAAAAVAAAVAVATPEDASNTQTQMQQYASQAVEPSSQMVAASQHYAASTNDRHESGVDAEAEAAEAVAAERVLVAVREAAYAALMSTAMDALRSLDVSYRARQSAASASAAAGAAAATWAGTQATASDSGAEEGDTLELGADLEACHPLAMQAFINLTGFLSQTLMRCGSGALQPWRLPLVSEVSVGASRWPLLSGYYRLAAVVVKLCDEAGAFTPQQHAAPGGADSGAGDVALEDSEVTAAVPMVSSLSTDAPASLCEGDAGGGCGGDAHALPLPTSDLVLTATLRDFIGTVLVACTRYKYELLSACLELVLSSPPSLLMALPASAADAAGPTAHGLLWALRLALPMGLTFLPVANLAAAALERWERQQPRALHAIVPQIAPLLAPYFSVSAAGQELPEEGDAAEAAGGTDGGDSGTGSSNTAVSKAEIDAGAEGPVVGGADDGAGSDELRAPRDVQRAEKLAAKRRRLARQQGLEALQPRLQLWLGRMGSAAATLAAVPPSLMSDSSTTVVGAWCDLHPWDVQPRLVLRMPISGLTNDPEVCLDELLPRASLLALTSPDRVQRVAACEFLHTATLWMVGYNRFTQPDMQDGDGSSSRRSDLSGLMSRLFPVLLRLASGAERVAQRLFGALCRQLVHWLTRSAVREGAQAMALLDALLEGLQDPHEGALRELCAGLCAEWLKYAFKHMQGRNGLSTNAQSLMRRLTDQLTRPPPAARLGAALALSRCALHMRGPAEALAAEWLLECLHAALLALRLADGDASGSGTCDFISYAISSLVTHCLDRSTVMVLQLPQNRRQGFPTLDAFLWWLLVHLASAPQRAARRKALALHLHLARAALAEEEGHWSAPEGLASRPSGVWLDKHCTTHAEGADKGRAQLDQVVAGHLKVRCAFTWSAPGGASSAATDAATVRGSSVSHLRQWLKSVEGVLQFASWGTLQGVVTSAHLQREQASQPASSNAPAAGGGTLNAAVVSYLQLLPPEQDLLQGDAVAGGTEGGVPSGSSLPAGFYGPLAQCGLDAAQTALRLLDLLHIALSALPQGPGPIAAAGAVSWGDERLGRLLAAALLAPETLGSFGRTDADARVMLQRKVSDLLLEAARLHRPALLAALRASVERLLEQRLQLPAGRGAGDEGGAQEAACLRVDSPGGQSMIQGLVTLSSLPLGPSQQLLPQSLRTQLPSHLFAAARAAAARGGAAGPPPDQLEAATAALQLSIDMGLPQEQLLDALLGDIDALDSGAGRAFYMTFRAVVHRWLIWNISSLAAQVVTALGSTGRPAQHTAEALIAGAAASLMVARQEEAVAQPPPALAPAAVGGASPSSAARALPLALPTAATLHLSSFLSAITGALSRQLQSSLTTTLETALASVPLTVIALTGSTHALPASLSDEAAASSVALAESPVATALDSWAVVLRVLRALLQLVEGSVAPGAAVGAGSCDLAVGLLHSLLRIRAVGNASVALPSLAAVQLQALQLLPLLLLSLQRQEDVRQLASAVDAFVVDMWPTTSAGVDKYSPAGRMYEQQLVAVLDTWVALCRAAQPMARGSGRSGGFVVEVREVAMRHIFESLLGIIKEVGSVDAVHLHQVKILTAFSTAAQAAWPSAPTPDRSQGEPMDIDSAAAGGGAAPCPGTILLAMMSQWVIKGLAQLLSGTQYTPPAAVRLPLLNHVLLPLLEAAPATHRVAFFADHARSILEAARRATPPPGTSLPSAASREPPPWLVSKSIGYRLMAALYHLVPKDQLQARIIPQLEGGNMGVMKMAIKDVRELNTAVSNTGQEVYVRQVRCAAWCAASALLAATQTKAALFAPVFHSAQKEDPAGVWPLLLDVNLSIEFSVTTTSSAKQSAALQTRIAQAATRRRHVRSRGAPGGATDTLALLTSMSSQFKLGETGTMGGTLDGAMRSVASLAMDADQDRAVVSRPPLSQPAVHADSDSGPGRSAAVSLKTFTSSLNTRAGDGAANGGGGGGGLGPEELVSAVEAVLAAESRGMGGEALPSVDDELDAHECMLPLVKLLERVSGLPVEATPSGRPAWLDAMLAALNTATVPRVVQLFLVKAIVHSEMRALERATRHRQAQGWVQAAGGTAAMATQQGTYSPVAGGGRPASQGGGGMAVGEGAVPLGVVVSTSDSIFARHAPALFEAMVNVVAPPFTDDAQKHAAIANGAFHYLLRDVAFVFLGWPRLFERAPAASSGATAAPQLHYESEVRPSAERLLRHLIRVAGSTNRDVLNTNVQYIRALAVQWGAAIHINGEDCLVHLRTVKAPAAASPAEVPLASGPAGGGAIGGDFRPDVRRKDLGLTLLALLLTLNAPAILGGSAADNIWKTLLQLVSKPLPARLAKTSGMLLGVMLKRLEEMQIGGQPAALQLRDALAELAQTLRVLGSSDMARESAKAAGAGAQTMVSLVERCSAYFPAVVDMVRARLLDLLPQLDVARQGYALETLRRRAPQLDAHEVSQHLLRPAQLDAVLRHAAAHPGVQAKTLQLLRALLPRVSPQAGLHALQGIMQLCLRHSNVECRWAFLHLLQSVWEAWSSRGEDEAAEALAQLRPAMLTLLADGDGRVRLAARHWWRTVLPHTLPGRLQALLELLSASPELSVRAAMPEALEQHWATLAAALLMDLVANKAEAGSNSRLDEPMYMRDLTDGAQFESMAVDTWQAPTLTMAPPLFSASQGGDAVGGLPPGMLRATASLAVAPTVSLTLSSDTAASLATLKQGSLHGVDPDAAALAGRESRLTRRLKEYRGSYRKGAIMGKTRREVAQTRQAVERSQRVTLLRQYRSGELPDVRSVKLSGFLGPLSRLVERDEPAALRTLVALVTTLARQQPQAMAQVRAAVASALAVRPRATSYLSALFALASADVGGPPVPLNPADVRAAAQAGASHQAAVCQLERQLLAGGAASGTGSGTGGPPFALSPQLASGDDAQATWSALSDLYKELGDWNLMAVVRERHLAQCPGTPQVMDAVSKGRHAVALQLCQIMIGENESQPEKRAELLGDSADAVSSDEELLWWDDKLSCLQALGRWRDVTLEIHNMVPSGDDDTAMAATQPEAAQVAAWLLGDARNDGSTAPTTTTTTSGAGRTYIQPYVGALLYQPLEAQRLAKLMELAGSAGLPALESAAPVESVVSCGALCLWADCRIALDRALQGLVQRWDALHPLATVARMDVFDMLQPLAECSEVLQLYDSFETATPSTSAHDDVAASLSGVLSRWHERWPEVQQRGSGGAGGGGAALALLRVLCVRQRLLDALVQMARRHQLAGQRKGRDDGEQRAGNWPADLLRVVEREKIALLFRATRVAMAGGLLDTAQELLAGYQAELYRVAAGRDPGQRQLVARLQPQVDGVLAELCAAQMRALPQDSIPKTKLTEALRRLHNMAKALPEGDSGRREMRRVQAQGLLALLDVDASQAREAQRRQLSTALVASSEAVGNGLHNATGRDGSGSSVEDGVGSAVAVGQAHLDFAFLCHRLVPPQAQDATSEPGPQPLGESDLTPAARQVLSSGGGAAALAARHMLMAMATGTGQAGRQARLHLPLLLSLLAKDTAACHEFHRGWRTVPLASYLPWASQMLFRLFASPPSSAGMVGEGEALQQPLQALATAFPQRMHVPVRLAWEAARQQRRSQQARLQAAHGHQLERWAGQLQDLTAHPVLAEFIQALDALTFPVQRWQAHAAAITRALGAGERDEAVRLYREEAWPDVFGRYVGAQGKAELMAAAMMGSGEAGHEGAGAAYNHRFAQKHHALFTRAFGPGGELISNMTPQQFRDGVRDAVSSELSALPAQHGRRSLAAFSPWFQAYEDGQGVVGADGGRSSRLLIPVMPSVYSTSGTSDAHSASASVGTQASNYGTAAGGTASRMGGSHVINASGVLEPGVAILGFGKVVDVFSSKQLPKRLTLMGDDFKEYDFVVKGAEDVRLDERVQRLFDVMNGVAAHHPGCAARRLALRTFGVVPLTPRLGLLEFVSGTKPLEAALLVKPAQLAAAHQRYVMAVRGADLTQKDPAVMYMRWYRTASRQDAERALTEAQAHMPWDALRQTLVRGAGSPELFLCQRAVYTRSLAATCVFGYVAGVGDRHLQNFLMLAASGELLPIDFGYSFGTATQALSVPELIPFRLTRQMLGVLQPHDGTAVLMDPITQALSALSASRQLLGSILAIFLREPLLEWLDEARLVSAAAAAASGGTAQHQPVAAAAAVAGNDPPVAAAPQRLTVEGHLGLKVGTALEKLSGRHPSAITTAELAPRHAGKAHWDAMVAVVQGRQHGTGEAQPYRAGVPLDACCTHQQQARCLLDQATDANILGRTWEGWRPYA